jgi:protein-tyrosine phosphatase
LNVDADDLEKKGISISPPAVLPCRALGAAAQAVEAVKPMGGDLTKHRSRPLSVELIHQADLVFTMSRAHAAAVTALVPSGGGEDDDARPGRRHR